MQGTSGSPMTSRHPDGSEPFTSMLRGIRMSVARHKRHNVGYPTKRQGTIFSSVFSSKSPGSFVPFGNVKTLCISVDMSI